MTFSRGDVSTVAQLQDFLLKDQLGRPLLRRERQRSGTYGLTYLRTVAPYFAERQQHNTDPRTRRAHNIALRHADPQNFLFTPQPIYSVMARVAQSAQKERSSSSVQDTPRLSPEASAYLALTSFFESQVDGLLEHLSYLGPLRERFQRVYALSSDTPTGVGAEGHSAPELLYWHQNDAVFSAVQKWVRRFEFNGDLIIEPASEDGFRLRLNTDSGFSVSVVDCGFGLSQVIPLIVEGLVSYTGSLLIASQPEIHLNPRLQATLGDLFVEIVNSGRRVILETHSEHLLLRVRRLVAEGVIDAENISILYVEKDAAASTVRQMPLSPIGELETEWPRGFFEDSLGEALALAQAQADSRKMHS